MIITMSGGFHNSSSINVRLSKGSKFEPWKDGIGELYNCLSNSQVKRLEKHFCGIKGCTCGSWTRATIHKY